METLYDLMKMRFLDSVNEALDLVEQDKPARGYRVMMTACYMLAAMATIKIVGEGEKDVQA